MLGIAILGFGTVGSGVWEIVKNNPGLLMKKAGKQLEVKRILDIRNFTGSPAAELLTKNAEDILATPMLLLSLKPSAVAALPMNLPKERCFPKNTW